MAKEALTGEIEDLIRSGKIQAARQRLAADLRKSVPRDAALGLANLARRAGLPNLSLRLLNPIVRPAARARVTASDAEKAEYAACLSRIGAGAEALGILERLDKRRVPEASLYEAHVLITRWDYVGSIPLLKTYIAAPGIDDYARTVAKVNLAAAYVSERQEEGAHEITRLLGELEAPNLAFLRAATHQLAAEHAIFGRRWGEAERHLAAAEGLLKETESLEAFFVRKWIAVLELLRAPRARRATEGLDAIRNEASRRRHWETLRDCDRFRAIATGDVPLLRHVYFGTPYESFRRRLLLDFGGAPATMPDRYDWEFVGKGKPVLLDLLACAAPARLKPGQVIHRMLLALGADFYRPTRLAGLHAATYPGEFFNPTSSPTRVHQAVKRLKRWLAAARLPLALREETGSYRLVGDERGACTMRMPAASGLPASLRSLRERFATEAFGAREAAPVMGLSYRSARRSLSAAKENGWIARDGVGASTRYRFRN